MFKGTSLTLDHPNLSTDIVGEGRRRRGIWVSTESRPTGKGEDKSARQPPTNPLLHVSGYPFQTRFQIDSLIHFGFVCRRSETFLSKRLNQMLPSVPIAFAGRIRSPLSTTIPPAIPGSLGGFQQTIRPLRSQIRVAMFAKPATVLGVKRFVKAIALLLLALWVPVTEHCRLETIPDLSFLSYSCQSEQAPHQDTDCQDDFCSSVESGGYKVEDNPSFTLQPIAPVSAAADFLLAELQPSSQPFPAQSNWAPPELSQTWQFRFRAAPRVRAPSLVS